MDFVLEHKWTFFILGEVCFSLAALLFGLFRYFFKLHKLSIVFLVLFVLNDVWLLVIGAFDYFKTGSFSLFQVIISLFLLYAFTIGKKDFQKFDRDMQARIARWRGEEPADSAASEPLHGKERAITEWKKFGIHFCLFLTVQLAAAFTTGLNENGSLPASVSDLFKNTENGIYADKNVNGIMGVWTFILGIDFLITLSYTLFPKKEKKIPKYEES